MRLREEEGDWKGGFLFVGNQLALDLLNTRPVIEGEPTELLSDLDAVVAWFQAAGLVGTAQGVALRRDWKHMPNAGHAVSLIHEFRETLRREVLAWEGGGTIRRSTIEEVNTLLAAHPKLIRLRSHSSGEKNDLRTESWYEIQKPSDLLGPLAHAAAELFTQIDRTRVRKCEHTKCVLHFLDTSKNGTRRWCSMKMCGNRLKVAAYAARQRD
jgi:predicted RNA-binding Zn ribbon-like protein